MVSGIFSTGLNAYQSAQKALATGAGKIGGMQDAASTGEVDNTFSNMLSTYAQDAVGTLKKGEAATISAAKGQAELTDVVGNVQNAMRTLELVTSVRDKVISAYQEIIRMPI